MKGRISVIGVLVCAWLFLLGLSNVVQSSNPILTEESLATPTERENRFFPHSPYVPYERTANLPEYPYNKQYSLKSRTLLLAKPAGIDLDVTHISRTPMYNRYEVWYTPEGIPYLRPGTENDQRWPVSGELVTFTAHIINKGTLHSGEFTYKWFVDEIEVHSGVYGSLEPGEEGVENYPWSWEHTLDGERLLGSHTVRFEVDPLNVIVETYENNNSLQDHTDAMSLMFALTPELYQALETPIDLQYPYSAEDWLQKQIGAMNEAFERSVYSSAPNGVLERVRLDRITIAATPPPTDPSLDGGFFMAVDDRIGNPYYDPTTDVSGALIHELSHQLGVIDLYNFGFEAESIGIVDDGGLPLQMETGLPVTGLMLNPGIRPPVFEEHSTLGLNSNKGYRRGYYGEYLYDLPDQIYLRVLNNRGEQEESVTVRLYQASHTESLSGKIFNQVPEFEGVSDVEGRVMLTNYPVGGPFTTRTGHTLSDNPFGIIDIVGRYDEFILELAKGDHQEFGWLEITQLNLLAGGGYANDTLIIRSYIPPYGAPESSPLLTGRLEAGSITLLWEASPSESVQSYNVYRTRGAPDFTYQQVDSGITNLEYTVPFDPIDRVSAYAVTAVDLEGKESGFSNFFNAFSLRNPAGVVVDDLNRRIVLDPQNGYALLLQSPEGSFLDTLGSVHYHFENSKFLTRDNQGWLILSHPGDWYTSRHSIRVADQFANPMFEFGELGSGPEQFQTPAGVIVWGQPCTVEGPLTVDSHTLLLVHYDGSYNGVEGEPGIPDGSTFSTGRYDQGVLLDASDTLTYETSGNLTRTQGAVELWFQPNWDGDDTNGYTFFEVGEAWFNRMRLTKDGANNLRFLVWDSSTEYGVTYNVSHWKAGEWHHIAATWQDSKITLIVDGQERDAIDTAAPPDSLSDTIYVGSSSWQNMQANGVIDELRISNIPRFGNSDTCSYRFVVADSGNHRLQVFDGLGNHINSYGDFGNEPREFNNPQGLAVNQDGWIVVADQGNDRLQVFRFNGTNFTYLKSIAAGFDGPTGVATHSEYIIVADTGNNKIKVLDRDGVLLGEYEAPNDSYWGTFKQPHGVAVDKLGRIVVADTGNGRVVTILNAFPGLKIYLPFVNS